VDESRLEVVFVGSCRVFFGVMVRDGSGFCTRGNGKRMSRLLYEGEKWTARRSVLTAKPRSNNRLHLPVPVSE